MSERLGDTDKPKKRIIMTSITPESLHRKITTGEKVHLLDVRTPREYAQAHVSGAVLEPLETFDVERVARQVSALAGMPAYVLCQSGSRARQAITKLEQAGLSACVLVEGGTEGWIKAGLLAERQALKGISLERQVRIAAGFLVLAGTGLGAFWHAAILAIPGFVGGGLLFAGISDKCGMALMLARMPWNRMSQNQAVNCCTPCPNQKD
jgi:rhodanese-related sulfurtransferase